MLPRKEKHGKGSRALRGNTRENTIDVIACFMCLKIS